MVELIVVIVILAIVIGVTIGGIYMYIGKATRNRDIKVMTDVTRQFKELSITDNVRCVDSTHHHDREFKNWTFGNRCAEDNFFLTSGGWEHKENAESQWHTDIKTCWESWFRKEIATEIDFAPKAKDAAFYYFWHTNEYGEIDYVIYIYGAKWLNLSGDHRVDYFGRAKTLKEAQEAVTKYKTTIYSNWLDATYEIGVL